MLSFEPLDEGAGLEIIDSIKRRSYRLYTSTSVQPEPIASRRLDIPVDHAVRITTSHITISQMVDTYVRDGSGTLITEVRPTTSRQLTAGEYIIELNAPIKLYLRVEGPLTISATLNRLQFTFDDERPVTVGGRSYHRQPAATITTTRAPADMMTAVSYLGSALKTMSCERSFPTLRGHPPTIELGAELAVPETLTKPDSGVRIELPARYHPVYVATPLAYYLGADVVPANSPRLVTTDGVDYELDTHRGFEREVERILKQIFFLDCLTRTEGYYQIDLFERECVESAIDLDFQRLYKRPLGAQLRTYLSVPFDAIEPYLPRWCLTAYVAPKPVHVELLPFLVDDLAIIRSPSAEELPPDELPSTVLETYLGNDTPVRQQAGPSVVRTNEPATTPSLVHPEGSDSLEQAWVADRVPLRASKTMLEAFHNRLDRTPKHGDIDITVVCNDREMQTEYETVDDVYRSRTKLPFDVTLRYGLSTAELRAELLSDTDFLHYIGHIEAGGFQCHDGLLDAATLDSVSVDAFLLNACTSYHQGRALIERGSIGGVVTACDVINSGAIRIGQTMARLLNLGFPLRAALRLAQTESIVGGQYIVVGDGTLDIVQVESGVPTLCHIQRAESGYELTIEAFPTRNYRIGTTMYPLVEGNTNHFLVPGEIARFSVSRQELHEYIASHDYPMKIEGSLHWDLSDAFFDRDRRAKTYR